MRQMERAYVTALLQWHNMKTKPAAERRGTSASRLRPPFDRTSVHEVARADGSGPNDDARDRVVILGAVPEDASRSPLVA